MPASPFEYTTEKQSTASEINHRSVSSCYAYTTIDDSNSTYPRIAPRLAFLLPFDNLHDFF